MIQIRPILFAIGLMLCTIAVLMVLPAMVDLSDGNADFAKAIGLSMDGSGFGLGTRSQRYSMVVDDGVVKAVNVEDAPSKAQHSGADNILKDL